MRIVWNLVVAVLGALLAVQGVRLATSRPRPHNLLGMVLAAVGAALALGALSAGIWRLGR